MKQNLLIPFVGAVLMGISTWVLITLVELQTLVSMMQNELLNIDKQIGRIYNFIDRINK